MTRSLSGRLSLWYLTSVGLIVLLFLIAAGSLFWVTLQDQIDHHVHIVVSEARQIVTTYQSEAKNSLIQNLVSTKGMTVVVLSPDGIPLLETNSPDIALGTEQQLQKILTLKNLSETTPTHFTENNIRFAALPVIINGGQGIVAVGYSTKVLYDTFYRMLGIVSGLLIFLILPITFAGHKLLKKQLHPLEEIVNQAKLISSTSFLSRRIIINSPTQELNTIQDALNMMLTQLELIFNQEREFFSDAAHTLKTPLAVLRSQIETAALTQKTRDDLLRTIDSANDMIQDLLFLSQISNNSPQKLESVSLTSILTNLTELATTLGETKNLQVSSEIQKNLSFKANEKLIQRALGNLVYNAVIYNQPQGSIKLSLKQTIDQIEIKIQDTGIGISKHDLTQIFSRFYRGANAKIKGSGLGLAISKAVIENLGGKITITSLPHLGTTVLISGLKSSTK